MMFCQTKNLGLGKTVTLPLYVRKTETIRAALHTENSAYFFLFEVMGQSLTCQEKADFKPDGEMVIQLLRGWSPGNQRNEVAISPDLIPSVSPQHKAFLTSSPFPRADYPALPV